jgi:hypothetical protein
LGHPKRTARGRFLTRDVNIGAMTDPGKARPTNEDHLLAARFRCFSLALQPIDRSVDGHELAARIEIKLKRVK